MQDDRGSRHKEPGEYGSRRDAYLVFLTDASAELEVLSRRIRTSGRTVVDVPLSLLRERAAVQEPGVVLLDADEDGALDVLLKLRELPSGERIPIFVFGREGGALRDEAQAKVRGASQFFVRPVNEVVLLQRLDEVLGPPLPRKTGRQSSPPGALASRAPGSNGLPQPPSSHKLSSLVARAGLTLTPGATLGSPHLPLDVPSVHGVAQHGPLSLELEHLLFEAELRVSAQIAEVQPPTPEEEIEAVLPAELLESLDEPIDDDDELDAVVGPAKGTSAGAAGTGVERRPGTGERQTRAGTGERARRERERAVPRDISSNALPDLAPQPSRDSDLPPTPRDGRRTATKLVPKPAVVPPPSSVEFLPPPLSRQRTVAPAPGSTRLAAARPASPQETRGVDPGDVPVTLAQAIASRTSGALCFGSESGVRRVLLREGDIVTVASGLEDESLVSFLGTRGELTPADVELLGAKLPPFGRHAGAALVAQGHLSQDQLWPVLRAHAEWLLVRCLRIASGNVVLEEEPTGRLKGEPSVFGGTSGVATFVEAMRRVVEPPQALERLGGEETRLAAGPNTLLLAEARLPPEEAQLLESVRGEPLSRLAPQSEELIPVVYALVLLRVFDGVRSIGHRQKPESEVPEVAVRALDEEAVRARVRARLGHVEEGDYFSILGVPRDATGYEIRRAFLASRRDFEPTRLLTPATLDLRSDVERIVLVLEEAYEILREPARRERYRRAIETSPE